MDEMIRAKVASGHLPREDWEQTRVIPGGIVGPCAGCNTPTTPHDVAVQCRSAGREVILHPDCYVIWEQVREELRCDAR
jgi:hypothetical protein